MRGGRRPNELSVSGIIAIAEKEAGALTRVGRQAKRLIWRLGGDRIFLVGPPPVHGHAPSARVANVLGRPVCRPPRDHSCGSRPTSTDHFAIFFPLVQLVSNVNCCDELEWGVQDART